MPGFAPILGKLINMDETAAITPPPADQEKEAEKMTEERILKTYLRHIRPELKNESAT